jgi:hypothetical protein
MGQYGGLVIERMYTCGVIGGFHSQQPFLVQSPINTLPEDAKVRNLINKDFKGWNTNLVKELFKEERGTTHYQYPFEPDTISRSKNLVMHYKW